MDTEHASRERAALFMAACLLIWLGISIAAAANGNRDRKAACLATKCAAGTPIYVESRCLCAVDAGGKP